MRHLEFFHSRMTPSVFAVATHLPSDECATCVIGTSSVCHCGLRCPLDTCQTETALLFGSVVARVSPSVESDALSNCVAVVTERDRKSTRLNSNHG